MKSISTTALILVMVFMIGGNVLGQECGWTKTGNNVYASNSGNVGIGTASPGCGFSFRPTIFCEKGAYQ